MAEQNPVIMDIAKTMYQASSDERTRNLLHGRELGERTHNTLTSMLEDAQSELADAKSELSDAHAEIARLTALLALKEAQAN